MESSVSYKVYNPEMALTMIQIANERTMSSVLALVSQLLEEVAYIFCFYKIIMYSAIQNSEGWSVPPPRKSESEGF